MMIKIDHLDKTLKGRQVLKQVSLTFEAGRIYGLKGRNGAGKTMLLRAMAGLIRPDKGSITIDGERLGHQMDFPPSLGLLIENASISPDLTLFKHLKLLARIKGIATDEVIKATIERVGLDPDDKRPVKRYSLGMKQRAALAQALFESPKLLLLDEPTNAIDQEGVHAVRSLLLEEKAKGATIIVASHNEEDLAILTDQIIYMADGQVVSHG